MQYCVVYCMVLYVICRSIYVTQCYLVPGQDTAGEENENCGAGGVWFVQSE